MRKPKPKSVLALDIGHKRIGIAGCDPLGITVTRLPALFREDFESDLKVIKLHCKRRKIKGLIVGIPLDEKGNKTNQAKHCHQYVLRLVKSLELPIAWINEHCSTWEAKEKIKLYNDRSGKIDSEVAGLLLEQWLNEGPDLSMEYKITFSNKAISPNARSRSV